jgi:hypothetical protein
MQTEPTTLLYTPVRCTISAPFVHNSRLCSYIMVRCSLVFITVILLLLVPASGLAASGLAASGLAASGVPRDPTAAPKAGFSAACRAHKSIGKMARTAEVVVEAEVVEVTPPRDNIYAVTLQVRNAF